MTSNRAAGPIFILGILPRSGTNFVFNLLRLHPDCGVAEPIWEDYTVEPSHLLLEYVRAVYGWWRAAPSWGVEESEEGELCRYLGQGLISFLEARMDGPRLLTKTPSVTNIENFFRFFPDAYLVVFLRDGRDLVESAVKSFGWDRDVTTRRWAAAAKGIVDFDRANRRKGLRYRIVRYEDLYSDLDGELCGLLDFLRLDSRAYDFDAARGMPVYGSSGTKAAGDAVHWRAVERTPSFRPTERTQDWTRSMHERFNWLAGPYLDELGYEPRTFPDHRLAWRYYNTLVDTVQRYRIYEIVPKPLWRAVKRGGYQLLRMAGARV